jgi:hypothetical protein
VSKIRSYQLLYAVMAPILPVLQRALPKSILTTEIIGRYDKRRGATADNLAMPA